jgi:hypothetical protein
MQFIKAVFVVAAVKNVFAVSPGVRIDVVLSDS